MKLTEIVKRMATKEPLTLAEKRYNENVKNHYGNINTTGAYNVEFRDLIKGFGGYPASVATLEDKYGASDMQDPFISRVTYYENLQFDTTCPYIEADGIEWKETGNSADGQQTRPQSEKLHPHRLTTQIAISREVLMGNEELEQQLTDSLIKAMYGKVVESILCDFSGSTEQPQGIFYGASAATITDVADLIEMQYNGDTNKTANVWVISPAAKKKINTLNYDLIRNGHLLNSECLCDNRAQSPYLAYLPLQVCTLGMFGPVSLTVDSVTKMVEGKVVVTIDFYCDFAYLDKSLIQLGVFEQEIEQGGE